MNPQEYSHLSVAEIEEMHFDPDYNCELTKSDLETIAKLPDQINLALPFLHTSDEIEAHRIINIFCKDLNESVFVEKDYLSDGGAPSSSEAANPTASTADFAEAEVVHDILVREARRDRIRAKGEGEDFSAEVANPDFSFL
jgi:hypothetical protein